MQTEDIERLPPIINLAEHFRCIRCGYAEAWHNQHTVSFPTYINGKKSIGPLCIACAHTLRKYDGRGLILRR